jgi:very-short-patch-repair endonuclease
MNRNTKPVTEHMTARGRQLRHGAPFPERLLWGRLRDHRCLGLKFRRQQPVGPYVADFYCAAARVVIELDGRSHEGQQAQDEERQRYLEQQGLKVLRFSNDTVLTNLAGVVEAIAEACKKPSPGPSGHALP